MPPKGRRPLGRSQVTVKSETAATVKVEATKQTKKKKIAKAEEDEENEPIEDTAPNQDWSEVMARALTVKQYKTLIKTLASNADEAVKQLTENELRHALWTATFVAYPDGQKFLVRALPKIGVRRAMNLIKKAIISEQSSKHQWANYGEVVVAAWLYYHKQDEGICKQIEQEMITALFEAVILVDEPLSDRFLEMLRVLSSSVLNKGKMDGAIYQASKVVLWRGCNANSNRIRYRACKVLFEFFPWMPTDADELREVTDRVYSTIERFLMDPCFPIRAHSVYSTLKICASYWTYIPSQMKRVFLNAICDKLVLDSEVSVRQGIPDGLCYMVMEAKCLNAAEAALKSVVPLLLADRNERIRLSTLKLLLKLLPNRFLKYFDVVPMEKLIGFLEIESSESVKKLIVRLIFKSFYQEDEEILDLVKRMNYLAKFGRNAPLTFYKLIVPEGLLTMEQAEKYMIRLTLYLYQLTKEGRVNDTTANGTLTDAVADLSLCEQNPKFDRIKLFFDCVVVLYASFLRENKQKDLGERKGKVEKLLSKLCMTMFDCAKETPLLGTTMFLGSLLPKEMLNENGGLMSGVFEQLNEVEDTDVIKPYLEAVTQWHAGKLLELIREGLCVITSGVNKIRSPAVKRGKKVKPLSPAQLLSKSLHYLAYIISSAGTNHLILQRHLIELDEFYRSLCSVRKVIDERLALGPNPIIPDDLILEAYVMKQTLICILLNAPRKTERDAEDLLFYVKDLCEDVKWFEESAMPYLEEFQDDPIRLEFFFRLGNTVLRKLCDILQSYDFASVPSISKAPSFIQPKSGEGNDTGTASIVELNFIASFKSICYGFLQEGTPSEFMPSIFNATRQLLHLNPDQTELAIATVLFVPTWVVARLHNGDELYDKRIEAQFFLLLKQLADNPKFPVKTFLRQLCQALIDFLQWCIQEAGDCADPREQNYELSRFVEILLFQSVRRHTGLFKQFRLQLGGRIESRDLFASIDLEFNQNRSEELVKLEILGACAQLTHLSDMDPDRVHVKKQKAGDTCNEDVEYMLNSLKTRVDALLLGASPELDNLLAAQVQAMLPT